MRLRGQRRRVTQAGFTIIEVLIALLILLIGIAGILSLQMTSLRATGFSRHATEASVVGEMKMEDLVAMPAAAIAAGSDLVDSRGQSDPNCDPACNYTRDWTIDWTGSTASVLVRVTWYERGTEPYTITLASQRQN